VKLDKGRNEIGGCGKGDNKVQLQHPCFAANLQMRRIRTKKRRHLSSTEIIFFICLIISTIVALGILFLVSRWKKTTLKRDYKATMLTSTNSYHLDRISHTQLSGQHFLVKQELKSPHSCSRNANINGHIPVIKHVNIPENTPLLLNTDRRSRARSNWQLCVASHSHKHKFLFKTYPNTEGYNMMKESKIDCDVYVSTSDIAPGPDSWDWKSADFGPDSITIVNDVGIQSDTLFISVIEKTNDFFSKSNSNRCVLELEIVTSEDEKLPSHLSLRGKES
jgi:hypothetical protein